MATNEEKIKKILNTEVSAYGNTVKVENLLLNLEQEEVEQTFTQLAEDLEQLGRI